MSVDVYFPVICILSSVVAASYSVARAAAVNAVLGIADLNMQSAMGLINIRIRAGIPMGDISAKPASIATFYSHRDSS